MNYLYARFLLGSLILIVLLNEATSGADSTRQQVPDLVGESADRKVNRNYEEEEDGIDLNEVKDGDKEFDWKYHQDDHSIYSGRSLLSTEHIEHHKDDQSTSIDDDDYAYLKTKNYVEKEWNLMFRALDASNSISSGLFQQMLEETNLFEEVVSRLKPECKREIYHMSASAQKHKLWAMRMLDSFGKIPSGISYGRFSSPGDYQQCIGVRVDELVQKGSNMKLPPEHHKFHGKYCLLDFRLPVPARPKRLLSVHDPVLNLTGTKFAEKHPEIANFTGYATALYDVGYLHAFCLPSTCDADDIAKSLTNALEGLHLIVITEIDCQEIPDEGVPLTKAQVISYLVLGTVFANAIFATFIHQMRPKSRKEQEKLEEERERGAEGWISKNITKNKFYTECFSIQSNFGRLTKPDPRGLTFVHYTRIVAMGLTVIVHTGALGTLQAITKPADASNSEQIFRDFLPQMLANSFTSIQIFFFMAGFMLVISSYPSIEREKGYISFLEFIIKRAIRLMPGVAAAICINFLWPRFVDGPMLNYFIRQIVVPCESSWWRTLFFLSNFDHVEKMCLRHSYFSASDYQLHIIAFPLLLLLYKMPTLSLLFASMLTVAGFVAQVIMVSTKIVLPFIMIDYMDKSAFFNVIHYIHHPVWNHLSAFFYGYIVGYLVVKQIRINLSPTAIRRIWLFILPAGICSLFAPYFWNHYKRPIYRWQMVLYVLFDRFIILSACAWISYAGMVLSRPAPRKPRPTTNMNLPDIVSLEKEKQINNGNPNKKEQQQSADSSFVIVPTINTVNHTTNQATNNNNDSNCLKIGSPGLPRQRSSPSLCISDTQTQAMGDSNGATTLRPATSSTNVEFSGSNESKAQEATQSEPPKKKPAIISNVNTLCLVLSRLTFQLYLFNMVALWIDVNHSKYYWFLGYYFIITKAFAIYIFAAVMSAIVFITMESPALSLYINWVNKRVAARAQHRARQESSKRQNNFETNEEEEKNQLGKTQLEVIGMRRDASFGGSSYDGLNMQIGNAIIADGKITNELSFIDLSPISLTNKESASDQRTKI